MKGPTEEDFVQRVVLREWCDREMDRANGTVLMMRLGIDVAAMKPDATRKEVLDKFNQGVSLECPSCNRSRGANPK